MMLNSLSVDLLVEKMNNLTSQLLLVYVLEDIKTSMVLVEFALLIPSTTHMKKDVIVSMDILSVVECVFLKLLLPLKLLIFPTNPDLAQTKTHSFWKDNVSVGLLTTLLMECVNNVLSVTSSMLLSQYADFHAQLTRSTTSSLVNAIVPLLTSESMEPAVNVQETLHSTHNFNHVFALKDIELLILVTV